MTKYCHGVVAQACDCKRDSFSSIATSGNELFINILISSLWEQDKAWHRDPPLNTLLKIRRKLRIEVCQPYYMRHTA